MAAMIAAVVICTVISEFVRGGRVIAQKTPGLGLLGSMVHLNHRNTRRYGGYIVHFGVAVVVIGILGTPFNKEGEKEMGYGDKMASGPYTLVCRSYTQEEKPNYGSESAILDVCKGDKQIRALFPERRFYKASQQTQTMPQIYPTFREDFLLVKDLYVVYEGVNQDTGRPIIKAHLNPMVPWIWTGLLVIIFGTLSALVPNAAAVRVTVPARAQGVPAGAGD